MASKEMEEAIPEKQKKGISIGWKLAGDLTAFAAVILLVTFLFQVVLLGTFFRAIRKNDIKTTSKELAEVLGTEYLTGVAYQAAQERSLGILIYALEQGQENSAVAIVEIGNTVPISKARLNELYAQAMESEELQISRVTFGGYEIAEDFPNGGLLENSDASHTQPRPKSINFLGTQIASDANGARYMMIISASYQPLNSTVRTLSMQYSWILAIVVIMTVVTVYLLYRRISKPLIRMTAAAQELAKGKYDTDFSGKGGFRETRELAQSLNYASRELSKNDKLQKELIANISHDLRTPLTMIKGYGEVIRDLPRENTPENIQIIIDETTRLSELVNDLLDLSKLQAGSATPKKSIFDMTDAICEIMGRYEAFTKHQGYTISFARSGQATVYADRGMMLQVLYNLINNAINYTGEDKTVRVEETIADGCVRVSVSDTGDGIPQDEVPYIWDRYYKVDKVHKRAMVGTGLGLSIVRQILDAHGAAYGVQSTIGKGSAFWFEVPITERNATED